MAGHMVEIVGLSLIAKPCGRSSRSLRVSQPPDLGDWPNEGMPVRITSTARPIAGRNRGILITHLSEPERQRERRLCPRPILGSGRTSSNLQPVAPDIRRIAQQGRRPLEDD